MTRRLPEMPHRPEIAAIWPWCRRRVEVADLSWIHDAQKEDEVATNNTNHTSLLSSKTTPTHEALPLPSECITPVNTFPQGTLVFSHHGRPAYRYKTHTRA